MDRAWIASLALATLPAFAAATSSTPQPASRDEAAAYRALEEATRAVVAIKVHAIANARSNANLGAERRGSGVVFGDRGLVLTIGYLVLEADQVEVQTSAGRTVPAIVAAYDPATGFGLVKPLGPLGVKPIALGSSGKVETMDRLMVASAAAEDSLSIATVVARRTFAGYWEYLIDGAIFTSPPRADFGGAALINSAGELVGIGSLFVMDAQEPGERLPGNMFVPIDLLKPVLDEMVATGKQHGARRPWLGVTSIADDGRVRVMRVAAESPAEAAGLVAGDVILAVSGVTVKSLEEFYRRLWASGEPGVEVALKVLKDGGDVRVVRVRSIDRIEMLRKRPTI
jgi:serine protease Do